MSTFDQRNHDFCKGMTDAQFAFIEAERRVEDLKAENAKLREELAKARDPQRIGGQADPSSFVYAIEQLREFRWQHATNDEDAIPYINNVAAAHERENAKLREKARELWHGHDCGGRCVYFDRCDHPIKDECPMIDSLRELGIEVPE